MSIQVIAQDKVGLYVAFQHEAACPGFVLEDSFFSSLISP
jgi:hypothetical protein